MADSSSTITLAATWTPTGSGCLQNNDYWIWNWSPPHDAKTVAGGPSQTTDCLPPGWGPTVTYAATACPRAYTTARVGAGANPVVTCCPALYSFTGVDAGDVQVYPPDGPGLACISAYAVAGQTMFITETDLRGGPETTLTRTNAVTLHLYAPGIVYISTEATSTSATTSSAASGSTTSTASSQSSSTTQASASASLSAGASAGIGVGAGAVVLVLGIAGWLFFARKRRARRQRRLEMGTKDDRLGSQKSSGGGWYKPVPEVSPTSPPKSDHHQEHKAQNELPTEVANEAAPRAELETRPAEME